MEKKLALERANDLFDSLLSSARMVITQAEELESMGSRDIFMDESIYQAQWLSLKFPETDLSWKKQHCEDPAPMELWELAYLLGGSLRKLVHGNMDLTGLVAFQKGDRVDFCISGSFSAEELQKIFAIHQGLPFGENKK